MNENLNRAFLYGESVFTTTRFKDGRVLDWDHHFDRLKKGVEFVFGPFTDDEHWETLLKDRIEDRLRSENGDKILRLTLFREQEQRALRVGLMSIGDLKIQVHSTPFDLQRIEGKAICLRTCAAVMRPHWWPGYLKVGSYLDVILAQKKFLLPGDDDLLFLTPQNTLLESSVANIFIVRHKKLYTAPVGPNVLDGVMRRKVLEAAGEFFDDCSESETTMEQALRADAVFGTNSVRGPFLIHRIDDHEVPNEAEFLSQFEALRKRVLP